MTQKCQFIKKAITSERSTSNSAPEATSFTRRCEFTQQAISLVMIMCNQLNNKQHIIREQLFNINKDNIILKFSD